MRDISHVAHAFFAPVCLRATETQDPMWGFYYIRGFGEELIEPFANLDSTLEMHL